MNEPYVLAVDDDVDVLGTLSRALAREGFEVGRASSGLEALKMLSARQPDLMILDIIMPGMDGLEVCRKIRANKDYNLLPVLFLTARGHTDDVVKGLDAGGDDYVVKPFEVAELIARVRALIRRNMRQTIEQSAQITLNRLFLDSNTHQVEVDGLAPIPLTATDHTLLRYLMEHHNQALSPPHLLEVVWDYPPNTGDPDLVRAHVRNLRAKLANPANNDPLIRTIHGVGYMIGD